uniref:Uncharacterized protein n=1 Tax=Siphoviridae sp. ctD6g5 TaxID=2826196 RepID=A0A8S5MRU1_9CAUD|nr:MAG TPA: hypothetical protein [Siphoviridae sp. ctD6g5]
MFLTRRSVQRKAILKTILKLSSPLPMRCKRAWTMWAVILRRKLPLSLLRSLTAHSCRPSPPSFPGMRHRIPGRRI